MLYFKAKMHQIRFWLCPDPLGSSQRSLLKEGKREKEKVRKEKG